MEIQLLRFMPKLTLLFFCYLFFIVWCAMGYGSFKVKKFSHEFLVVIDRADVEEANETIQDALVAKIVELQRLYVEIMKNILPQKTRLKFCNVIFLKWVTSNQ